MCFTGSLVVQGGANVTLQQLFKSSDYYAIILIKVIINNKLSKQKNSLKVFQKHKKRMLNRENFCIYKVKFLYQFSPHPFKTNIYNAFLFIKHFTFILEEYHLSL